MLHFKWDPQKDLTNQKKHGGFFCGSCNGFRGCRCACDQWPGALRGWREVCDPQVQPTGKSAHRLSLLQASESVIRIISARKATKNESKQYHEGWDEEDYEERIWFFRCQKEPIRRKGKTADNDQPEPEHGSVFQRSGWKNRPYITIFDADHSHIDYIEELGKRLGLFT